MGGRVRDEQSKKIVAKQLGENMNDLAPQFDVKTGQIKSKKAKKEKTPEQEAAASLKLLEKKCHVNYFFCETLTKTWI